jgi:NAD(P)-dependent dehydrogenase (short-subunit alcohol dehydrogenase family)
VDGKVALVVGGASGIGRGIAGRVVAAGGRVVIADRSAEGSEAVVAELGDAARPVVGDVTSSDDVERFVATAVAEFGSLDISVNSAGVGTLGLIHQHPESEWDRVVDICLKGTFLTTKHASARMVEQGTGGVILNVASINARQPAEGFVAYCSAKAGVEMLTKVAAMELGRHGIRVVGIAPGFVDTPLTAGGGDLAKQAYVEKTPLGRTGEVEDIAAAAEFLMGDGASWISGETLVVDGAATTREYPRLLEMLGML